MRRAWAIFLAALGLAVLAEAFVGHEAVFGVERVFAWNALYGFLACAVLVVLAKAIGLVLKRSDRYYDD